MFILKFLVKILLLPILLLLGVLRLLVKIGINLSSIILGGLMLVVFGCIIYAIYYLAKCQGRNQTKLLLFRRPEQGLS